MTNDVIKIAACSHWNVQYSCMHHDLQKKVTVLTRPLECGISIMLAGTVCVHNVHSFMGLIIMHNHNRFHSGPCRSRIDAVSKTYSSLQTGVLALSWLMPRSHFGDRAYDCRGFKVPGYLIIHPAM